MPKLDFFLDAIEWLDENSPFAAIFFRGLQRCVNSYLSKCFFLKLRFPKSKSVINDLE